MKIRTCAIALAIFTGTMMLATPSWAQSTTATHFTTTVALPNVHGCSGFAVSSVSYSLLPAPGSVTLTKDSDKCSPSLYQMTFDSARIGLLEIDMQDLSTHGHTPCLLRLSGRAE